ncbi:MAG: transcription termination factor Rho [Acidimicrobiales bacterium]
MSGEQQLERSVLERKERDELHAIAEAMALKPGSRTKKADIIDQILRATGIEGDGAGAGSDRVRRARSPRSRATGGAASGVPEAVQGELIGSDRAGNGSAPETDAGPMDGGEEGGGEGAGGPEAGERATANGAWARRDPRAAGPAPLGSEAPARADVRGPGSGDSPARADASGSGDSPARAGNGPGDGVRSEGAQGGGYGGRPPSGGGGPGAPARQSASAWAGHAETVGEAGNRRGRRRRGRERDRAPERGERDLQGGSAEAPYQGEPVGVKGLLDLRDEGFGFLRTAGSLPSPRDVYVSVSQVRRFALRRGDQLEGASRPAASNEKYPALVRVDTISGLSPDEARQRPRFEDLTPLFPDQRLKLEVPGDSANMTARIVDLLSPIGKGQRGLIVSPSKAGKTTVLKQIAHSIEANNPEVHLMVLLVAERPEEVTDMRRSVKGEVVASTFDRPSDEHTAVAELTIERAKRLVEHGGDVVIILDGITRLARAYNLAQPATGRIMSGGVDSGALYPPKRFFGSARNIEEGGSLTILATALVETGSRMDEVIFEEFKGTGNMELRLDRRLAERRIYPAIDVNASSTRHEELLFDRSQLQQVWKLRRVLNALASDGTAAAGLELLMDKIKTTRGNDEFLAEIAKGPAPGV